MADEIEIKIPNTVKDPLAYLQYKKLIDSDRWKKNELIDTSIGKISMRMTMMRVDELVKKLPKEERDLVRKKIKAFKIQYRYVNGLKRKAYGHKLGGSRVVNENLEILDERSSELIGYFGQLRSVKEVKKIIEVNWGYATTEQAVRRFKNRHEDEIAKASIEYVSDTTDIRLSHKRGRLEEMESAYFKRKAIYERTNAKSDEDSMRKWMALIMKECEEKKIQLEANIKHTIEANINVHVQQEMLNQMPINDIVIARAASRMGVNPRFLISRLHNSVYAKHTGMVEPENGLDQEEIIYPSKMVYNWKNIKAMHKKEGDANIELAEYEEVKDEESSGTLRQLMLDSLKKKKESIAESKIRLEKEKNK